LVFLVSLYTSAVFGGAITAVLFNVAGHPGNIATVFNGRPLMLQGRAGEAIAAIVVAGAIDGIIATIALTDRTAHPQDRALDQSGRLLSCAIRF
jgi:putative tricarboxylic transport membrane protein